MTMIVIGTDYEPRAAHPPKRPDTRRPGLTIDHIIDLRDAETRRSDGLDRATWEDAE